MAIAKQGLKKDEFTEVMENKIMYDLVGHFKFWNENGWCDTYQQESDMI